MLRIIKLGIISIVVFAFLITGISLFFPSHIRISKAVDIKAGKETVMVQIKDISNWKNWYPGADSLKLTIHFLSVSDSSVTAVNAANNRGETGWTVYEANVPNAVTVQWYMDFHLHWYPWEKFSSLLLEKRYGPSMEKGLDNLKKLLEKQ
jgi:hypothetical protein